METNFLNLVKKRFSCRKFIAGKKIEKELILTCIEAARLAPSASNSQPWKYVVIENDKIKQEVVKCLSIGPTKFNQFAGDASNIIVVVEEPKNLELTIGQAILGRSFADFDIGLSVMQFCLQATELGLATCILGIFDEKSIKRILKIPKNKKIVVIIALGYPDQEATEKKRKDIDKIYSFDFYE